MMFVQACEVALPTLVATVMESPASKSMPTVWLDPETAEVTTIDPTRKPTPPTTTRGINVMFEPEVCEKRIGPL